jgi:hypothetical protein
MRAKDGISVRDVCNADICIATDPKKRHLLRVDQPANPNSVVLFATPGNWSSLHQTWRDESEVPAP